MSTRELVVTRSRMRTAGALAVAMVLVLSSCGGSEGDSAGGSERATDTESSVDLAVDEGFAAGPPRLGEYQGSGRTVDGLAEATSSGDEIRLTVEAGGMPFGAIILIEADCAGRRFRVQPETRRPDALQIEAWDANNEPVSAVEDADYFIAIASLSEHIDETFFDDELTLEDIVGDREPSHIRWSVMWGSTESVTIRRSILEENEGHQCWWDAAWQSED